MWRGLAALKSLTATERRTLFGLAFALPWIEASMRIAGVRRTGRWLDRVVRPAPVHSPSAAEFAAADRLARLAMIAGGRSPVPARCLSQSLLVRAVLRRRGLDALLRLGVRKDAGDFDAHAWVELAGRPLAHVSLAHAPLNSNAYEVTTLVGRSPSDDAAEQAPPRADDRTT